MLTIGTRVAFARQFLRDTAQFTGPDKPTHVGPFARGTIARTHALSPTRKLVHVLWDDGALCGVLDCNLVDVSRLHLEAV